jgi:adenylate cyclase
MTDTLNLTQHGIIVLLVDDQLIIGEAVRRMLSAEKDIEFHHCSNPTSALQTANRISPTVILQDLVMPEMDGLRLVRYFRANSATRHVPLIVLSTKEEASTKAEAFSLGANDYLVKLPDKLELIARIRYHSEGYIHLLERNEAYDELLKSRKQLEIRNRFIRKIFGRYLSDDVVDSILESPEGLKLGGEKRQVTILMSDLRGFSNISEQMPAEDVVRIINIYLKKMTEIILKYQGTIDEFIGDAILVIFGAPMLREDDPMRAMACAMEMQLAMTEVNAKNQEKGYPIIAQGIGINTGEVVVGNIGSEKRSKYGVVGRNVNLASRIESYTVGGQVLISESTKTACGAILKINGQMEVMPKGVDKPINIYDIGGIGGEYNLFLPKKMRLLRTLVHPIAVQFRILEGKYPGKNLYSGKIIRLGDGEADIESNQNCSPLTNIVLTPISEKREFSESAYAKVIKSSADGIFNMRFTSVPPETEAFLKECLT